MVVLILLVRYLDDLRAVVSNQRAEIDMLKAELKGRELVSNELREANTELLGSAKENNVLIVDLRDEVTGLTEANKELADRVSTAELDSQRVSTLEDEATEKDDKIKGLQDRVAALETASAAKAPHSTKSQTSHPPAGTTGTAASRATAGMSGSVPRSLPRNTAAARAPAIGAWNSFAVDDAHRQAQLRHEAAVQAADDAKNGISNDPVEPTFTTSFKQVRVDADGKRTVLKAVKDGDGADTTGTADSRATAGMPGSVPASGPSTATPSATEPAVTAPATPTPPAAGPSSAATRTPICIRFQKGDCQRGTTCKYAHVTGQVTGNGTDQARTPRTPVSTSRNVPRGKILCPFFMKGACKYGSRCYNSHVVTDETVYSGGLNAAGHKPSLGKANK